MLSTDDSNKCSFICALNSQVPIHTFNLQNYNVKHVMRPIDMCTLFKSYSISNISYTDPDFMPVGQIATINL